LLPFLIPKGEPNPGLWPAFAADMPGRGSNLETDMAENASHWGQQEHGETANGYLLDWLGN